METPPVVQSILDLFAEDNGVVWNDGARFYAKGIWDSLSSAGRTFLIELTTEDLSEVVIGEVRDENLRLYHGKWQPLPKEVEIFLFLMWDVLELGDPEFTKG